ncbi:MAG TPA: zinc ABC transporter substrate-binding protein [Desulfatiglandales bacterium]|nr:zinc ABC transporter substrate-binding protein [Desulfatiglandales bacterium]
MERFKKSFLVFLGMLSLAGCLSLPPAWAKDPIKVFVSIAPQKYFVQQIGKDLVDVQVMVDPGASPATYEPKPRQMVAISKTILYFSIGVPFEHTWLKKLASTNPNMRIVYTDHGIGKFPISIHHHYDENEHHKGAEYYEKNDYAHKTDHYEHGIPDPHIWLSPPLVMMQARSILMALQEVDPSHRSAYEVNYKTFISELLDLDAELRNIFFGKHGLQFMVFHPAWGYFAHTYGLKQVPIEIEGKDPKPAQLGELIRHAKESNIKVIFVQPQFSTKSAQQVAKEIGGQIVFANPLAENWMENLREQAEKFRTTLR